MNATRLLPHFRRTTGADCSGALAEARSAISSTCDRLANCSSDRLPGRALGSLAELQRATDHLRVASSPRHARAHQQLIEALDELSAEVADLARRSGSPEEILHSRGLARAERALARLAA